MAIELFDPVGVVEVVQSKEQRVLENLTGKRAGCIFNQHVSSLAFWQGLETELEASVKPSSVHRVYKANTWAPAPKADVERLLRETDYALVGVGA
jgi:hypothetical protein